MSGALYLYPVRWKESDAFIGKGKRKEDEKGPYAMSTTEKQQLKTAGDIMIRDVKTIPHDATLRDAATLLTTSNISGAPVVDDNGKVVGIISESDLLNEARKQAGMPHLAAFGLFIAPEETLNRIYKGGESLLAEEVMSKKVITVTEDTPVKELGDLMLHRKINRVPVVSEDGALVGIVTREDVLRSVFNL